MLIVGLTISHMKYLNPSIMPLFIKSLFLIVLSAIVGSHTLLANDDELEIDPDWQKQKNAPYTKKGADRCLKCHDEDNEYPILPIFRSKHGQQSDPRSPMAGLQCEACHGPGANHAKKVRRGKLRAPIINFGKKSNAPVEVQNKMCLQCHTTHARMGWQGSSHEQNGLACANCHRLHVAKDPIFKKSGQPNVCFKCHKRRQSEFQRSSSHPVRFGEMKCTNCHNTHDAMADKLIDASNKNEKCYECHAEKRGPFLWEHQPVVEDCTVCHTPHGSNHGALLKKTTPFLCQQCHTLDNDHANSAYSGEDLPTNNSNAKFTAIKSCLNCHSRIHGSNHPSGVRFNR